ncbi:hypothetical protein Ddye_000385 [Dipteronia dyeriana]|uniref:Uncharacterized protein n=1 Tax=Dipteronia dyeriana TaxID=168575 RepID=A0AAE0CSH7_9ROSI|nr:hypothetical protein Ddye_000385 [Dipteronia dyeriana]
MEAIPLDKIKSIKDDVVAQVLGKVHRGRVRGLGLGVTPTRVHVSLIGNITTMQLQAEMKDLRQLVKELQNAFNNQPQYSSNSNLQGSNKCVNFVGSSKSQLRVSTSEKETSPQKGTKCKLLHWIGNEQIAAEAAIDCTDP